MIALRIETFARQVHTDAKKLTESVRLGNVSQLRKSTQNIEKLKSQLSASLDDLERASGETLSRTLKNNSYTEELARHCRAIGLDNVKATHNALLSHPHRVTIDGSATHLKLGNKTISSMRPSIVTKLLKQESERDANTHEAFFESLQEAYFSLTNGDAAISVPLTEIYNRLTLLPKIRREYTESDFFTDICFLDSSGPKSLGKLEISFPASTSARMGRGYVSVSVTGHEKTYASLRFDRKIVSL